MSWLSETLSNVLYSHKARSLELEGDAIFSIKLNVGACKVSRKSAQNLEPCTDPELDLLNTLFAVAESDMMIVFHCSPFVVEPFQNACVTSDGALTSPFRYIPSLRAEGRAQQAESEVGPCV